MITDEELCEIRGDILSRFTFMKFATRQDELIARLLDSHAAQAAQLESFRRVIEEVDTHPVFLAGRCVAIVGNSDDLKTPLG